MPGFDGDVDVVRPIVAIDGVLGNQRAGQIERFDRQIEQTPRVGAADGGRKGALTRGQAEDRLSTAAPRGSVAHGARLEQGDAVAALRQVQCSRTPGNAAAEHDDVHPMFAAKRFAMCPCDRGGQRRRGRSGGRVVRLGGWIG
jgi:hypothetical protein